jgi:PKHD-type hydroxylase
MLSLSQVEAAFSPDECDRVLALADRCPEAQAALVGGTRDPGQRRARVAWLDETDEAGGWLITRIMRLVADANRDHFQFDLGAFDERMQVARYDAGDAGHFDWHSDIGKGPLAMRRKLTLVVQLSDGVAYDGGDFETNAAGTVTRGSRSRGTMFLFPSFLLHRVTPVSRGTRASLTLWVHGPAFR